MATLSLHTLACIGGLLFVPIHPQRVLPQQRDRQAQTTRPADGKLDRYARDACGRHPLIRVQATRRLVRAGQPGFEACKRFVTKNGRQALSPELTEALGRFDLPKARRLLHELVNDRNFFWRPQAMRALAGKPSATETELFRAGLEDRSYLVRRAALSGWVALRGRKALPEARTALADRDQRVRVHAAGLLLDLDDASGLPLLVAALDAEEAFFGEDFGLRLRQQAFRILRRQAGEDFGYRAGRSRAERRRAVAAFEEWARKRIGDAHPWPRIEPAASPRAWLHGYERRSCRRGNVYLRIDGEGRLWRGLFTPQEVELSAAKRKELVRLLRDLEQPERRVFGDVRCDFERFTGLGRDGKNSVRCGPGSVPGGISRLAEFWRAQVDD